MSIDAPTSGISARWHGGDCRGPSSITSTARRTMRSRIGEIPKRTSGEAKKPKTLAEAEHMLDLISGMADETILDEDAAKSSLDNVQNFSHFQD